MNKLFWFKQIKKYIRSSAKINKYDLMYLIIKLSDELEESGKNA